MDEPTTARSSIVGYALGSPLNVRQSPDGEILLVQPGAIRPAQTVEAFQLCLTS
ncbi:MAG: hypothetical protein QNJ88_00320 [Acidimicrobiia bacterium]|nr:hypothetical protein [Acidimicrobiia bacterium]